MWKFSNVRPSTNRENVLGERLLSSSCWSENYSQGISGAMVSWYHSKPPLLAVSRKSRSCSNFLQHYSLKTLPTLIITYIEIWFCNISQNYVTSKITFALDFKLNISITSANSVNSWNLWYKFTTTTLKKLLNNCSWVCYVVIYGALNTLSGS